ncbi:transcriptional regulator, partial [Bacillus thuringiensis]|nr:transcriptional regulator [Bacillus thuringiensis]
CLHDKPGCLINGAMLAAEEKMEEELRNQKIVDLAKKIKVDF